MHSGFALAPSSAAIGCSIPSHALYNEAVYSRAWFSYIIACCKTLLFLSTQGAWPEELVICIPSNSRIRNPNNLFCLLRCLYVALKLCG